MTISNLHEQFVRNLEDMYYAENKLLDTLSDQAGGTEREAIAQTFRDHREETRTHLERLETAFDTIGRDPQRAECDGIDGLLREHERYVVADPDQRLLDYHNLVTAKKIQQYEISSYRSLTMLADRLGHEDLADLFEETCDDERTTLDDLSELATDFDFDPVVETSTD